MMLEAIGIGAVGIVWGCLLAMRNAPLASLFATAAVWYACREFAETGASLPFVAGAIASFFTHVLWLDRLRRQATPSGE